MRFRFVVLLTIVCAVLVYSAAQVGRPAGAPATLPDDTISFRITFGYSRLASANWDGSISVTGGQLRKLSPWRFSQRDAITGPDAWRLDVKRLVFENQPDRPNPVAGSGPAQNLVPAGVFVTVDRTATSAEIRTPRGTFSVPVSQLAWGRMLNFFDGDVLVERVPSSFRCSTDNTEQHDNPSLAVARDGTVWTAWQAYENRGDHVYARQSGSPPERLTQEKQDVYRTSVAEDDGGRVHVVWSQRMGNEWHLVERVNERGKWGPLVRITTQTSPNIFHKLAPSSSGPLRLVWVGHDNGESFLYTFSYENGRWSSGQKVGGPGVWSPDAATDSRGNLHLAWDSYQNGNYDIFYRRVPAGAAPEKVEQVTSSQRFQAHPSVAIDPQDRPWLAWDESGMNWGKDWNHEDPNRATTLYADRGIKVVLRDGGGWKQAGDFATAVPERLRRYWQLPHLAIDGSGRVWALFQIRTAAQNNRDDYWCNGGLWDLFLTTFENGTWKPASMVPNSTARPEVPFNIAAARDRVWMLWATDGRQFRQGGFGGATMVHYEVYAAQASAATPPGPLAGLTDFEDPEGRTQIMHPNERKDVARIRAYRTSVGGTNYRIMRGDFHRHTEISSDGSGDGSVEDYYRYMMDVAAMDTGIIGDHNMGGDVEYSWWRTEKSYDVFHVANRFTPLFGYERSVNYPNGHRNMVFDHRGIRTLPITAPEQKGAFNSGQIVYPYLRQNRGICMEHSLATGQGTDYRDNDPQLEPLVEIYQGYHASYEYKGAPRAENDSNYVSIHGGYQPAGFWWNALAKGLKLGVQSSSDHISTHCSYAMVYTPDDNRANIVENMRRRHAYAATDNIIVDFQAEEPNGTRHLMGEEFATRGTPKLRARILGTDIIMQVDLIRNNEFLYSQKPNKNEFEFEYLDKAAKPGESYYYLRVIQQDKNLAWSSPIWIKR